MTNHFLRSGQEVSKRRNIEHPYFQEADHLCIYMSYNGEVGTDGIIRRATASGKRVWIPRVDGKDMEFYELRNRQELVRSSYGILEPPKGNQPLDMQDFQNCLMIMPGVAFDRQKIGSATEVVITTAICLG